jgi:hypothetical protein
VIGEYRLKQDFLARVVPVDGPGGSLPADGRCEPWSVTRPHPLSLRWPPRRLRLESSRSLPTVLRPVRFITNYLGAGVRGIDAISGGVHRHLLASHESMQVIALEDIAGFAAVAFADPAGFAGPPPDCAPAATGSANPVPPPSVRTWPAADSGAYGSPA